MRHEHEELKTPNRKGKESKAQVQRSREERQRGNEGDSREKNVYNAH